MNLQMHDFKNHKPAKTTPFKQMAIETVLFAVFMALFIVNLCLWGVK